MRSKLSRRFLHIAVVIPVPLLWRETADWLYSTSSDFPYCNEYTFTDIGSAVLGCGTASAIIDVGLFYTTPTTSAASSQSVPGGLVSSLTSAVSYPSSSSQLTSSVSVTNTPTPTPFTESQQSFGGSPIATQAASSHVSSSGSNKLVLPGWGMMSQWRAILHNFSHDMSLVPSSLIGRLNS